MRNEVEVVGCVGWIVQCRQRRYLEVETTLVFRYYRITGVVMSIPFAKECRLERAFSVTRTAFPPNICEEY